MLLFYFSSTSQIAWMYTATDGVTAAYAVGLFRRGRSFVSWWWTLILQPEETLNMADTKYNWQGNVNKVFVVFCASVAKSLRLHSWKTKRLQLKLFCDLSESVTKWNVNKRSKSTVFELWVFSWERVDFQVVLLNEAERFYSLCI